MFEKELYMWVACCGMNRSGSTMQYMLTTSLVEAAGRGTGMGFVWPRDFNRLFHEVDDENQIRVVKSHDYIPAFGDLLRRGRAKALFIHRDPRDVAVSYMNVVDTSFWSMIARGFLERCIRNGEAWTDQEFLASGSLFVSEYQAARDDPRLEARQIDQFLELGLPTTEIDAIAEKHSADAVRRQLNRTLDADTKLREGSLLTERTRLLYANHINHGGSGQWKGVLTDFQLDLVEFLAEDWMRRQGYSHTRPAASRRRAGLLTTPIRGPAHLAVDILRAVRATARFCVNHRPTPRRSKATLLELSRQQAA